MKIKQTDKNVVKVNFKYGKEFSKKVLHISDVHLDNPRCRQNLLREDLEYIKKENGIIVITGDLFDAMQGRNDRRSSKAALRKELLGEDYFDKLVNYVYDFLKPYAEYIAVIGDGNHETSVMKNNEINLNRRLVEKLRTHNPDIYYMPYKYWIIYAFESVGKGGRKSIKELHHHGSGGSSPVTRGAIGTNRRAVNYPNADIIISGHSHQQLLIPMATEILTQMGKVKTNLKYEMVLGTYKEELEDGRGWAVEKGLNKKTLGAGIVEFYYSKSEIKYKASLITHC